MRVVKLIVPPLENNVYIIHDEKEACLIDVALGSEPIIDYLKKKNLKLTYVINTHAHIDHTAHNKKIKSAFPNTILVIHEKDAALLKEFFEQDYDFIAEDLEYQEPDMLLKGGELIEVAGSRLKVIHTPGHTPGSICLFEEKQRILFSGDTLFLGTYGRIDFPYSSEKDMMESLRKLAKLPKETLVYPGHGSETRIGLEFWLFNL